MALDNFKQLRRASLDLEDRIHEIHTDLLPELDRRLDEAEDPDVDDRWRSARELRQVRDTLEGQAEDCELTLKLLCPQHEFDRERHGDDHPCPGVDVDDPENTCEHLDGVFVISALNKGESAQLQDDVIEASVDYDLRRESGSASPKEGFHQTRLIELSVVNWPDEMDTRVDPTLGDREVIEAKYLPDAVADYFYQAITQFNDANTVEGVGNLSDLGLTATAN